MLVTLSGIITLVKPVQPLNASLPILVTGYPPSAEGITTSPLIDELQLVISALPLLTE